MRWVFAASPNGIAMCEDSGVYSHCAKRTATRQEGIQ